VKLLRRLARIRQTPAKGRQEATFDPAIEHKSKKETKFKKYCRVILRDVETIYPDFY